MAYPARHSIAYASGWPKSEELTSSFCFDLSSLQSRVSSWVGRLVGFKLVQPYFRRLFFRTRNGNGPRKREDSSIPNVYVTFSGESSRLPKACRTYPAEPQKHNPNVRFRDVVRDVEGLEKWNLQNGNPSKPVDPCARQAQAMPHGRQPRPPR